MTVDAAQPQWASQQVFLEYLRWSGERVDQPTYLPQCLAAAEDFLAQHCGRHWPPNPATLQDAPVTYTVRVRPNQWRLQIPDLRAVQAITFAGTPLVEGVTYNLNGPALNTDGSYWPADVVRISRSMWQAPGSYASLAITGWWGWDPIPSGVVDAVYRLAARLVHEQKAAYSDAVVLPEGGLLQYFRQLPATVQAAVQKYQRVMLHGANVRAAV